MIQQEVEMLSEWNELTRLTGGAAIAVERVRLLAGNIAIEGSFALPPLARLSTDDQVFVMAFVGTHGSIKEMERLFGISYPTVKNRLDKLAAQLKMVESTASADQPAAAEDVLGLLEQGRIDTAEALRRLAR
jgi:hypothetical protein